MFNLRLQEYRELNLSDLAVALVFPALRKKLEEWNPLLQPATGAEVSFFVFCFVKWPL